MACPSTQLVRMSRSAGLVLRYWHLRSVYSTRAQLHASHDPTARDSRPLLVPEFAAIAQQSHSAFGLIIAHCEAYRGFGAAARTLLVAGLSRP
eukprot:3597918-Lingulodinium_polyedra.AAC.1